MRASNSPDERVQERRGSGPTRGGRCPGPFSFSLDKTLCPDSSFSHTTSCREYSLPWTTQPTLRRPTVLSTSHQGAAPLKRARNPLCPSLSHQSSSDGINGSRTFQDSKLEVSRECCPTKDMRLQRSATSKWRSCGSAQTSAPTTSRLVCWVRCSSNWVSWIVPCALSSAYSLAPLRRHT